MQHSVTATLTRRSTYSTARVFFLISHPSQWGRLFYPLQPHSRLQSNITVIFDMHTVIPLQSHCVSTQMGGITVGYKTLILTTQFKQDKVHTSDSPHCSPTQSSSETIPVFSLQCFHRNGWNHSGVRIFNPFHTVLLPNGMGRKLKPSSSCTVDNKIVFIIPFPSEPFRYHIKRQM